MCFKFKKAKAALMIAKAINISYSKIHLKPSSMLQKLPALHNNIIILASLIEDT